MKALSLFPYWAHLVLMGEKTIETRTWKTDYRGDLLVCASKEPKADHTISGEALCVVRLVGIERLEEKHLKEAGLKEMPEEPKWAWILEEPRLIETFPVKGMPRFFDVPDEQIKYFPDEADPKIYTDLFKKEYVAKMQNGFLPIRSLWICTLDQSAKWEWQEDFYNLFAMVLELAEPPKTIQETANQLLGEPLTDGKQYYIYKNNRRTIMTFLMAENIVFMREDMDFFDSADEFAIVIAENFR